MESNYIENYALVPLKEGYLKELYLWNTAEENFELFTCRPIGVKKTYEEYEKDIRRFMENKGEKIYVLIDRGYPDQPLGRIKISDYNPRNHSAEFGYYFPEANRGKGFGSIMLKKFLKLIFEDTELCLNKLYATICSNNIPSINLLDKHGFKLDGKLREHYWIDDKKYDQYVYSILKNELV